MMACAVRDGNPRGGTSNSTDVNAEPTFSRAQEFWRAHAWYPAIGFFAAFALLAAFDADRRISHAFFYDAIAGRWIGEGPGSWWARDILHGGGRWLVRGVAAFALGVWIASFARRRLRRWRRPAAFAFLALLLSTAIVGGLKSITNVDCPWDLAGFGGDRPHVGLLENRPDDLPKARCFPGAHASSGYALMFGYFLWLDRSRRKARLALAAGIAVGLAFSFGQEARGAHFVSHDLAAGAVVWFVQLLSYRAMLATR